VPEKKPGLDALIDVIAPMALDRTVSGDAPWPPCRPPAAPAASPLPSKA
jgi:hypothetical protein